MCQLSGGRHTGRFPHRPMRVEECRPAEMQGRADRQRGADAGRGGERAARRAAPASFTSRRGAGNNGDCSWCKASLTCEYSIDVAFSEKDSKPAPTPLLAQRKHFCSWLPAG